MKRRSRKAATGLTTLTILAFSAILVILIVTGVLVMNGRVTPTAQANSRVGLDARLQALAAGTIPMTEIPTTLPAGGVTINQQFVLKKLAPAQISLVKLTAGQAIAIGRTYANAQPFAASTLLASFTDINSLPAPGTNEVTHKIQNVATWVVTFTTNNPQNVLQGKKPSPGQTPVTLSPRHFTIVLDASTGAFVRGFFTL